MDLEHFYQLKDLIKLEQDEEFSRYESSFSDRTLKERELKGQALTQLVVVSTGFSPGNHVLVELERLDGEDLPTFSFDVGEGAVIYAPKVGHHKKPRAVVYERTKSSVTLALNRPLHDEIENSSPLILLKSANTVVYKYMEETLDFVRRSRKSTLSNFRDVASSDRKPEKPNASGDDISFINPSLNEYQKEAIKLAVTNPEIFLVHGPPGTGKTTVLVEIIAQAVKKNQKIYVCAPSNTACDHLLKKITDIGIDALRLGHPARISQSLRKYTTSFKVAEHELSKLSNFIHREILQLSKKLLRFDDRYGSYDSKTKEMKFEIKRKRKELGEVKKEIMKKVLSEAQIFIGTLTGVYEYMIEKDVFDLVVIDEATQATEPMSWIPIIKAKKIVMAGDPKQLPATVLSKEAQDGGLGESLFERFHKILDGDHKRMLRVQYRMNEKIMKFPSKTFYDDKLIADESVKEHLLSDLKKVKKNELTTTPFQFIDTAGKDFQEEVEKGSESVYSADEIRVVLYLLKVYIGFGVSPKDIAVITPYSAQARRIKHALSNKNVEVGTVDGFQGREKELIIFSCVRSNVEGEVGFLADVRRMNVALTRAKRKLILLGDSTTLSRISFFEDFIKYAESIDSYKSIWEIDYE